MIPTSQPPCGQTWGNLPALCRFLLGGEADELELAATLFQKSDGAFQTLGVEGINDPNAFLEYQRATFLMVSRPAALMSTDPAFYFFDLYVSLTDQRDAIATLNEVKIELLDLGNQTEGLSHSLPIKHVLAVWVELGGWM